jgi:hypothetical protein
MINFKQIVSVSSVVVSLCVSAATAATFVVPPDRVLVQKSDAIVRGTVLASHAEYLGSGAIVTVTDVSVGEVLKGQPGRIVHVYAPGGVIGDRATIIPGAARFAEGEEVLLMLRGTAAAGWGVTDLALGRFTLTGDAEGRKLALRDEGEITGWDMSGEVHHEPRRAAMEFLQFVREVVAGRPVAENYYAPAGPLRIAALAHRVAANTITTPLSYSLANVSNADRGYRWSEFIPGVTLYKQNSASANSAAGDAAIQAAINAWTSSSRSGVAYSYGGANSAAAAHLDTPDAFNAVHFDVDMNTAFYGNVAAYVCGGNGLVAMGGITNASGAHAHPVSGEAFYSTTEIDVDVNSGVGACNSFLTSAAWTAVMTHEVGHTLGFRHANEDRVGGDCALAGLDCTNTSVMNSAVSGSISTLQPWDTRALQAVYPCTGQKAQDFNNDCKSDIVVRNSSTGDVVRWLVSGAAVTNGAVAMTGVSGWTVAATGDFNGDGYADLVFRNPVNGDVMVSLMNGTSGSSIVSSPGIAWVPLASADVNGDGKSDIVLQNSTTGDVAVWLMDSFTVTGAAVGSSTTYKVKFVGDTNGDGKADIILQDNGGNVVVWLMNGLTLVAGAVVGTPGTAWQVKAVGDCNGDGKADILLRNTSTGEVAEWTMNGQTLVGGAVIGTPSTSFDVLGAADYNGDGKADLLLQDTTNGDVAEWQLNGQTIAWGGLISTPGIAWQAIVR